MNTNPAATLWLIAYEQVTVKTYTCLLRDILGWSNLSHYVMGGTSTIERARSTIASGFLKKDEGDVLLMVDHDVQWEQGDLQYIARKALERKAIVGGLYPMRTFAKGMSSRLDEKGAFKFVTDTLVKARYLAGGFLAITKNVLEAISKTLPLVHSDKDDYWPFFQQMIVTNKFKCGELTEFLTEDWALCHRARGCGQKVLAAFKPRLKHEGTYNYRMVDARSQPLPDEDVTLTLN